MARECLGSSFLSRGNPSISRGRASAQARVCFKQPHPSLISEGKPEPLASHERMDDFGRSPPSQSTQRLPGRPSSGGLVLCPVSPCQHKLAPPSTPEDALGGDAPASGQSAGQRLGQPTDGSHGAAPSGTGRKDLAAEQDLAKEILLGIRAVEPPEEHEITDDVELGLKVSSSAWAQRGPLQVQAGPEEDHDHLHHPPQDNAGEANAHRPPPRMLSLEVQSVPEEDRDHLHHG